MLQAVPPEINLAACKLMHAAAPDSGRLTKPCSNGPKECKGKHTQHLHEHQEVASASVLMSCAAAWTCAAPAILHEEGQQGLLHSTHRREASLPRMPGERGDCE